MTIKIDQEGTEVEVYTAEEFEAAKVAERSAVEGEYKPKLEDLSGKLTKAEQAAAQRAVEFGQFRKLSEDQVKQLSEKDTIIYNNTLKLQEVLERDEASKKATMENARDTAIRAKVGNDEKLFLKVKDMYSMIGIEAQTQEQIDKKVLASLGALGQTEPDLIAGVLGFSGGSFEPPRQKGEGEKTFADTDRGKAMANALGLKI